MIDSIKSGKLNDEIDAYKVSIDISMIYDYLDNAEAQKDLVDIGLYLNNELFNIFIKHLNYEFALNLCDETFDLPLELIGVDKND